MSSALTGGLLQDCEPSQTAAQITLLSIIASLVAEVPRRIHCLPAVHWRPSSHLLTLQVVAPPRMEHMQRLRALQAAQKQQRRQKRQDDAAQR